MVGVLEDVIFNDKRIVAFLDLKRKAELIVIQVEQLYLLLGNNEPWSGRSLAPTV